MSLKYSVYLPFNIYLGLFVAKDCPKVAIWIQRFIMWELFHASHQMPSRKSASCKINPKHPDVLTPGDTKRQMLSFNTMKIGKMKKNTRGLGYLKRGSRGTMGYPFLWVPWKDKAWRDKAVYWTENPVLIVCWLLIVKLILLLLLLLLLWGRLFFGASKRHAANHVCLPPTCWTQTIWIGHPRSTNDTNET